MKIIAFVAALAAVPVIAAPQPATNPADPSAPALAPAYRSLFQGLPLGVEEEQLDWKEANADVARFPGGHADYVKWEEQQQGAGASAPTSAPAVAPGAAPAPVPAPATAPAPAARPQGHRHH